MTVSVLGRETLVQNLSRFKKDLVNKLVTATEITQQKVVSLARAKHGRNAHGFERFITRTGGLEQSIAAGSVKVTDERIEGEVQARMPYASFVEQGTSKSRPYPFMVPAIIASQPEFERRLKSVLHSTGA